MDTFRRVYGTSVTRPRGRSSDQDVRPLFCSGMSARLKQDGPQKTRNGASGKRNLLKSQQALTPSVLRNQVCGQLQRGFESLRLRSKTSTYGTPSIPKWGRAGGPSPKNPQNVPSFSGRVLDVGRTREGSLRQRSTGRWEVRWQDEHGRRHSKSFELKRDAQAHLRKQSQRVDDVLAGVALGRPLDRLFGELCDEWLATRGASKRSVKTDESFIRAHLRPAFESMTIASIGPREIAAFKAARAHLTPNTVNHHLTLLGSMLRHAVELGWLQAVPKVDKYKLDNKDYSYLRTPDELARFLAAAKDDPSGDQLYPLFAFAAYTGMRLGEISGLRADAVDLARRLITVRASYDGPTKSGESRYVPILNPLLPLLEPRMAKLGADQLVFTGASGDMLTRNSRCFREGLARTLKRAGLGEGYITFHDLRHTFASHWMMGGGDLFKLQQILGHASIEMTQRYAHLAPHAFLGDLARLPDVT